MAQLASEEMDKFKSLLADCTSDYGAATEDDDSEWPNNLISRQAVWERGVLHHSRDVAKQPVSDEEVQLCERLAIEAGRVKGNEDIGMGSDGSESLAPFYLVAVENEPVATKIDDALIRSRFGGTLFPPVTITVEPLEESGHFWGDLLQAVDGSKEDDVEEYLKPWRDVMGWFKEQSEFKETAFVYVGDWSHLMGLREDTFPPGTQMTGSCLPRLVLGLTEQATKSVLHQRAYVNRLRKISFANQFKTVCRHSMLE